MSQKIINAIDTVEHRIECASKSYNDSTIWCDRDTSEGDGFIGTYQEWIDQAFDELRDLARKVAE
jgi:hypothetical protein